MKKIIFCLTLTLALSAVGTAQDSSSKTAATASNKTSAEKTADAVVLESGTQISGKLENSLNADKARVGDQVVLKQPKPSNRTVR